MLGLQIAFKDFNIGLGQAGSPWVGFKHFRTFFNSYQFSRLLSNTMVLSVYSIVANILPPILLAVLLNECRARYFKKAVQTITYAPYFLSVVVVVGMIFQLFSQRGVVNTLIERMGGQAVTFTGSPDFFRNIYVWSGVWQVTGYNAVIYIATLAGINPELHEAAMIDGANLVKKIWYVDLPSILPTAIILLILSTANILNIGFEKVYLLQNPLNLRASDVISTYVYTTGLKNMDYSFASAVGMFQSVISLVLMAGVNKLAKTMSDVHLW